MNQTTTPAALDLTAMETLARNGAYMTRAEKLALIDLARRSSSAAGNERLTCRTVSVDVSTGDEDSGNRIFALLTGETGSDGKTLLAVETSRNFSAAIAQRAASAPYAWHYKSAGGVSVFHKSRSARLEADMEAARQFPDAHTVTELFTQQAAPEAPATTAIERFRAECAEATRALKAYEAPASAQINDSDAPAKAVYRLFDGAEEHPWRNGGNSNKQDEARRYSRAAIEASAQPVAAGPAAPPKRIPRSSDPREQAHAAGWNACRAAMLAAAPAVPVAAASVGWKWVPVEPTPEMITATAYGELATFANSAAYRDYKAMVAAAPAAPVAQANTCAHCNGTGQVQAANAPGGWAKCGECSGSGRAEVAQATTASASVDEFLEAHAAAAIAAHEHGEHAGYYTDLRNAEKAIRDAIAPAPSRETPITTAEEFFAEARRLGCKLPDDVCAALAQQGASNSLEFGGIGASQDAKDKE